MRPGAPTPQPGAGQKSRSFSILRQGIWRLVIYLEWGESLTEIEEVYLDEFDYLESTVYLNCCSVAMQPKRTLKFCEEFQRDFVKTLGMKCYGEYELQRYETTKILARMIHCSAEEIQLTHNTTEGDCLLMRSYPFQAGDGVVVSSFDYPAMVYGWYQLQEKGVVIKNVPAVNGMVRAEDIIAAIDNRTRVVSISQVQYMSGYKTDLMAIGQACHERGILFSVDGAQGLGRNEIDVKKMHISVLSSASFKGMLGVLGAAFYYCEAALLPRLTPHVWSEANIDVEETEFPTIDHVGILPYKAGMDRLMGGSVNTYGILAMGISAGLLLEIGIDRIHTRVLELEQEYRRLLAEAGIPVHLLGDDDPVHWSGNVCLTFDGKMLGRLEQRLEAEKICATVRRVRGEGFLRIGLHYYNTESDLHQLVNVLQEVLTQKQI